MRQTGALPAVSHLAVADSCRRWGRLDDLGPISGDLIDLYDQVQRFDRVEQTLGVHL